jgi:hypothetical protein
MMQITTKITDEKKLAIEANENSFWAHLMIIKGLAEDMREFITNNATVSKDSAEVFNNVQDLCDVADRLDSLMDNKPEHGGLTEELYSLLIKPYDPYEVKNEKT